ncbi:alpha/beta fold hydrolase [Bradyrhizobium sp. LA7.1]|uniref:alpha/beta fold hydrolase n=1 Tax=Bradyrhizobium sp. LA7.1 TaxID=3156324 RepID=UPI003396D31A
MKSLVTATLLALIPVAQPALAADKPAIALVHGAWETSQIWDGVARKLERDGYRVLNINLPGRAGSPKAAGEVTLDLYRSTVLGALGREKSPVVLVGHSFGGITLANVAEAEPSKIKSLVFVAAFVPQDGQSLLDLATHDSGSQVGPHLQIQKEAGLAAIEPAARGALFANDADAGVQKAVAAAVVDEPLAPLATPVHLTAARFGAVHKVYIRTARDQVISPAFQDQMITAAHIGEIEIMPTGHTPFVTDPAALVAAIEKVAR